MAHPSVESIPPNPTPLSFRRADGSRREFLFDDRTHSLPHQAASLFWEDDAFSAQRNGNSRVARLPRNVLRIFRNDRGEPASHVTFNRQTRQSVCGDGEDRSRCKKCRRVVTSMAKSATTASSIRKAKEKMTAETTPTPPPTTPATSDATVDNTPIPPYRWHMMSPQRVFRDLVMSDVAEPLQPTVRDALFDAFNTTVEAATETARSQSKSKGKAQQDTPSSSLGRPLLPSPPPSPTKATADAKKEGPNDVGPSAPASEFHYFSCLPYEIRRMIWELALPFRVLLREDLDPTRYHNVRDTQRPASHTHTIEMLWKSDLFYTCVEARRVVEEADSPQKTQPQSSGDGETIPLVRHITSPSRLRSGRDVLFYPWLGSEATQQHSRLGNGSAGLWMAAGRHEQAEAQHNTITPDATVTQTSPGKARGYPRNGSSSAAAAAIASTASATSIASIPYGHWASQLRLLRLPITTVALDITWMDRYHTDTMSWIGGVDLSGREGEGEDGSESEESIPPPTSLQVVVGDFVIPVRIRLDASSPSGITPAQKALLKKNITAQPWLDAGNFQRAFDATSSNDSPSAPAFTSFSSPPSNLNGMDFTVLVDLYDDWRIEELLSLQTGADSTPAVNKAALHQCIGCTRRAWEKRAEVDKYGRNAWTASPGNGLQFGAYLQKLCRPTLVFSVVLSFVDGDE